MAAMVIWEKAGIFGKPTYIDRRTAIPRPSAISGNAVLFQQHRCTQTQHQWGRRLAALHGKNAVAIR
jgi:hypothetical protein